MSRSAIEIDGDSLGDFDRLSELEWLETNGLGGWASSTVSGAHSRRYHGLLVAATRPPVGRTVLISKLDENVVVGDERVELGCNRYPDAVHPRGFERLVAFRRGLFPEFEYRAGDVRLRKTVAAIWGANTTVVVYEVLESPAEVTLELRPFATWRDFHSLGPTRRLVEMASFENDVLGLRLVDSAPAGEVFVHAPGALFQPGPDWYRRFEYEIERRRGLDAHEDLWTPGVLVRKLRVGERLEVVLSTENPATEARGGRLGGELLAAERERRQELLQRAEAEDSTTRALVLAADQFIVRRDHDLRTIIAGYHWFSDWGRDTMIALPGLCLATRRHDDAAKILRAFAKNTSRGMLPNRFPDDGDEPEYNTVDATLWFFVAIWEYLQATADEALVREDLLPVLGEILAWHDRGTRYGIGVDDDGLLRAGEPGVQLTWMDAKVGDWVVTPRQGKAVEINALWTNALAILGELEKQLGDFDAGCQLSRRAEDVRRRFNRLFWNDEEGCLFDVVDGDRRDPALRPNQLLALSLPFPLLSHVKARQVLQAVEDQLATSVGLRSLSSAHPDYRPAYGGEPLARDGAYHQGTVWGWLLGPFLTALIRYRGEHGRRAARRLHAEACRHLADAGVGSFSEIFDGEPPHTPRGCIAQAWSVAEVLRVADLLNKKTEGNE